MQLASLQNLTLKKMLHVNNIEQEKFFNRREADLVDSGHDTLYHKPIPCFI